MAEEQAILAGGCFWCTEAVYNDVIGVTKVESGYIGGHVPDPSYRQVCGGDTGHAEAIRVTFDPEAISYDEILDLFFATHDPTQLNRQGNDDGTQYRSAVFPLSAEQEEAVHRAIERARADCRSRSSPRSSPLPNGGRPRITTRIIGPATDSAIPIASPSSRRS